MTDRKIVVWALFDSGNGCYTQSARRLDNIEIIKRYQPKVYMIENPLSSRIWSYIEDVLGFDIPVDNPTYYGSYDNYPVKKPTKFKSNINLGLRYINYYAGTRLNLVLKTYNARSNILLGLVEEIYNAILTGL